VPVSQRLQQAAAIAGIVALGSGLALASLGFAYGFLLSGLSLPLFAWSRAMVIPWSADGIYRRALRTCQSAFLQVTALFDSANSRAVMAMAALREGAKRSDDLDPQVKQAVHELVEAGWAPCANPQGASQWEELVRTLQRQGSSLEAAAITPWLTYADATRSAASDIRAAGAKVRRMSAKRQWVHGTPLADALDSYGDTLLAVSHSCTTRHYRDASLALDRLGPQHDEIDRCLEAAWRMLVIPQAAENL
jgi:hypothetical protein